MSKIRKCFILALVLVASLSSATADTHHLVRNGELGREARTIGKSWKEQSGFLSGGGVGEKLAFRHAVDGSQFLILGEIALENPGHTAAGLSLGAEFLGFDGRDGFFTEGGVFGATKFHDGPSLKAGEFFSFSIKCQNGELALRVDGKTVLRRAYRVDSLQGPALRPHRATMRVRSFSVAGKVSQIKALNHLFACGEEGYQSYRIPALVRTPGGALLAFCEGRKNHAGDHGNIDLVMKRSTDGGKSWSELEVILDNDNHVAGNPVPIVDRKRGRILLISCLSSHSEHAIYQGKGRRRIMIQHSDDDGVTWSQAREISKGIYPADWRWYATGPCSGIQIREGRHAGRLVCPANHTVVGEGSDQNVFRAHCLYSDDGGETWQLGESSEAGGNESSIAEVAPDLLIQSIRMQSHRKGLRAIRYSRDGGESWSEIKHHEELPCPRCQGAVIRDYSERGRLIHSNPGSSSSRSRMTLRLSEDGGKTWPRQKLIHPGSSAYSDIALTGDGRVAVLYEGGHQNYAAEGIVFELHELESLLPGE